MAWKLVQYEDVVEGCVIPSGALITFGDIIGWCPHDPAMRATVLEEYVCLQLPLLKGKRLVVWFATGIAPVGRWWVKVV